MTKEDFFVGINNPGLLRREILLSTRNALHFLKQNEVLKDVRIEKVEQIMEFKNDMKEINALMNRLKDKLPKVKIRLSQPRRIVEEKYHKKIKKSPKPKQVNELDKLEVELSSIEKKLGRLR